MTGIGGIFRWRIYQAGEEVAAGQFPNMVHGPWASRALYWALMGNADSAVTTPVTHHCALWGFVADGNAGAVAPVWTFNVDVGTYAGKYGTTPIQSLPSLVFAAPNLSGGGTEPTASYFPDKTIAREPWVPVAASDGCVEGALMSWTLTTTPSAVGTYALLTGVAIVTNASTSDPSPFSGTFRSYLVASGIFSWVQTSVYTVLPQYIKFPRGGTLEVTYTLCAS